MNTINRNKHVATLLAFICVLATAVANQITGASAKAAIETPSSKLSPALQAQVNSDRTVLVTATLTGNSFLEQLPARARRLLNTSTGSTAARLAAQRNPAASSDSETVAAAIAENSRNAALPMIRKAARTDISRSRDAQSTIRTLGGEVLSASPIPNQVTFRIRARALPLLARDPHFRYISPAHTAIPMAAPIDGSSTWWANGLFGQGSSLDGNGSPDAVVFDQGVRTTHVAFKTRMPGDCNTCDGSGPTRIISPTVRTDFAGSKHANMIAAQIASTSLSVTSQAGMAYGIDKLYDSSLAYNPYLWDLGINTPRPSNYPNTDPPNDPGLGGNTDLPEVINYSAGIYEDTVDLDPNWNYFDALESRFGILQTVSAGNCGIADPFYTNCGDGPHRVSAPGTNYNVVTVGGLDTTTVYPDTSGYIPWANTSPGPTWGGRKKPDVIAPATGTTITPSAIDNTSYVNGGTGTSNAAPIAAAGALLLASNGVYKPTAQKAIMINSATPVQGQTYWSPRTGWGALNMSNAYYQRGNYANASVTASGTNGARFFKLTGVSTGDRSTLVWNRRTNIDTLGSPSSGQILNPGYYNLTNLDLSQFDPGTLATTSTGGSDAADTVDTDQTVTAANPMPGNGSDGGDNVEQIRSTSTGTQILKVKAMSTIDGATSEPFSIASADPVTPVATPIPTVSVSPSSAITGLGQNITVTATITNPSADLALSGASAELTLPTGTSLIGGANPQPLGTLAASGTATATWTIQGNAGGMKNLDVSASGSAYGEPFAGGGTSSYDVDGTPPVITFDPTPSYSATSAPTFSWGAADSLSAIASYDVQTAIDSGAWGDLLTGTNDTNTSASAADGQTLHLRVRATDSRGNTSGWSETATTVDTSPPEILLGQPTIAPGRITVPLSYSNIGAPVTSADFSFGRSASSPSTPLGISATFVNNSSSAVTATLTVTVTDSLGRSVTRVADFSVPPAPRSIKLRLARLTFKRGVTTFAGSVSKPASGRAKVTVSRAGSTPSSRTKYTAIRSGRYSAGFRLTPGRYRVVVEIRASETHKAARVSRRFTIPRPRTP